MSLKPDVRRLLTDTDIGGGQGFVIIRRSRVRYKGRMGEETVSRINAVGSVQPAGVDVLQQLPEGDRSGQVIIIRTATRIQTGSAGDSSDTLSDEVEYNGGRYKILQLKDWSAWGMWTAYATRIGDVDG